MENKNVKYSNKARSLKYNKLDDSTTGFDFKNRHQVETKSILTSICIIIIIILWVLAYGEKMFLFIYMLNVLFLLLLIQEWIKRKRRVGKINCRILVCIYVLVRAGEGWTNVKIHCVHIFIHAIILCTTYAAGVRAILQYYFN